MARFRKKPVEIEAVQLSWATWNDVCALVGTTPLPDGMRGCYIDDNGNDVDEYPGGEARIGMRIPTLEGTMLAREGDWIIRGVAGEIYPCKPDIFERTYEPVGQ